jgi:Ohr subfamily peroxiredoxin
MKPLYTAVATTRGGRQGRVESSDGNLDLPLSVPKELGGEGGKGTNPEQLFAAGYAACFESALRGVAQRQGKEIGDASVTASVGIGRLDGGGYGLSVELRGEMPGLPREEAEELMRRAHEVCPYSNATRGNVEVRLVAA